MKKFKYLALATVAALGMTSCSDFGDVNVNPESLNEGNVPMASVFSNAQHQLLGSDWDAWRAQCIYAEQWMQHINSSGWTWDYGSCYSFTSDYSASYWQIYSDGRGAVRDVTTALDTWAAENKADDYNLQLARITRVLAMSRLTDCFGDIPYTQGGRPTLYSYPEYDTQESIYKDMLKELDEAHDALKAGATAPMGSADLYYQGDCSKWRGFASSLMLRLALRLINVDSATSETYVKKAISNGDLILDYADNCILKHDGGSTSDDSSEPVAKIYAGCDVGVNHLSGTLVMTLQNNGIPDPRLGMMGSIVATDPEANIQNANWTYGDMSAAAQVGLPVSYSWTRTSTWFVGRYPEMAKVCGTKESYTPEQEDFRANRKTKYSQVGRYSYSDPEAPTFIVTAAETNLAMAEICARGFAGQSTANAAKYYQAGIEQGVYQFKQFPKYGKFYDQALADCPLKAYVDDKLAKFDKKDLEGKLSMIGTQYWITTFADSYEEFANWRRTGYPELISEFDPQLVIDGAETEVGIRATEGAIPRRFTYPLDEENINEANYTAACNRLHGVNDCYPNGRTYQATQNSWYTRVWWDVRTLKKNEQKPTTPWGGVLPFKAFE